MGIKGEIMDTSEKYIKMCEKAEEIQEEWEYLWGDFFALIPQMYVERIDNIRWKQTTQLRKDELVVWLPMQDQLQEMVWLRVPSKKPRTLLIWLLNSVVFPENPPINKNIADDENKYWEQFDSMEQLWLAFVMSQKFNKIWDEEKEEWIKQ